MSNNDGFVITLSEEAEQCGFEMGMPFFKIRDVVNKHNIRVRSSNYTLYGDLSERIRETLQTFTPHLEYYSIDEMFLDLSGFTHRDLSTYCQTIKQTVQQWTGVPVSIGVGETKTLAKVAMEVAKEPDHSSVQVTTDWDNRDGVLGEMDVGDIWGIGPAYEETCKNHGIQTAYDLMEANPRWVLDQLTVTGRRRQKELSGQPCIPLEENPDPKDNTCSSQIFGQKLTEHEPVRQAIVDYATRAARRIRDQDQCATAVSVFVRTSRFERGASYANRAYTGFNQPTDATHVLAEKAVDCLESIYQDGYRYHKGGVMLHDLVPKESVQRSMIESEADAQDDRMGEVVDSINQQLGAETVQLLGAGMDQEWSMNQDHLSRRYTTQWMELPEPKAGLSIAYDDFS